MKKLIILTLGVCAAVVFAADNKVSPALEKKYENATEGQLLEALNELSSDAISDGRTLQERQKALETAWTDPEITSPEIEEIRQKIAELDTQLRQLRQALREAVGQHPDVQKRREDVGQEIQKRTDKMTEITYIRQRLREVRAKK